MFALRSPVGVNSAVVRRGAPVGARSCRATIAARACHGSGSTASVPSCAALRRSPAVGRDGGAHRARPVSVTAMSRAWGPLALALIAALVCLTAKGEWRRRNAIGVVNYPLERYTAFEVVNYCHRYQRLAFEAVGKLTSGAAYFLRGGKLPSRGAHCLRSDNQLTQVSD